MNRWLASRWLVITVVFGGAALWLSWYLKDASAFTAIGTVGLGGGWAHNGVGRWTDRHGPPPTLVGDDVPMGSADVEDL